MGWNNLQAGFAGLGGREYVFYLMTIMEILMIMWTILNIKLLGHLMGIMIMFSMLLACVRGSRGYLHAPFTMSIFVSNVNLVGEDMWTFFPKTELLMQQLRITRKSTYTQILIMQIIPRV